MPTQNLYLRSNASAVCVATTMKQLTTASGGTLTALSSCLVRCDTADSFREIPGTTNNSTASSDYTNVHTQGYIFDAQVPATYASGTWTIALDFADSNTTSGADFSYKACLFVVTTNGSMVTKVSAVGSWQPAYWSPVAGGKARSATFSAGTVSVHGGQYLYLEVYSLCGGNGLDPLHGFAFSTESLYVNTGNSSITTPSYTVLNAATASDTFAFSDSAAALFRRPVNASLTASDTLQALSDTASKFKAVIRLASDNVASMVDSVIWTHANLGPIWLFPMRAANAWLTWYLEQPPDSLITYLQDALFKFYDAE
jgi:hypothetical protein